MIKMLANGVRHYLNTTNESLKIFVNIDSTIHPQYEDIGKTNYEYKRSLDLILQMVSDNQALEFGIYLDFRLSYITQMTLIEETLENDPYNRLPIGLLEDNCEEFLNDLETLMILPKLKFLTCFIPAQFSYNPVEGADQAFTKCDSYRNLVNSMNSSVEVMCISDYSPIQIAHGREIGSAINFDAFWCRIASKLKSNRTLSRFIMAKVFDDTQVFVAHDSSVLNIGGLWRRKHGSAYDHHAFVDVTEEFPVNLSNATQKKVKSDFLALIVVNYIVVPNFKKV